MGGKMNWDRVRRENLVRKAPRFYEEEAAEEEAACAVFTGPGLASLSPMDKSSSPRPVAMCSRMQEDAWTRMKRGSLEVKRRQQARQRASKKEVL